MILDRAIQIMGAVIDNPLVYLPLIGAWFITESYFIINCDEPHGHTYVMSTGLALIFTAFMISPFAVRDISWSLMELRTFVVMVLFFYGVFLVFFGIMKLFPGFLAEFFGAPGHALIPGMMAILYIEHGMAFDRVTFVAIVAPVLTLSTLKTFRRLSYKLRVRRKKDE
ncbi:MAG: hypothetical protein KAH99_04055 [Verrucomicrobia bacterium]|nr:hypothetical protein [Verrucomicrobiota bacterium]